MKKYIYPFLFILMGFLALSPFSSWLLIGKMGFPLALPELFFIPFAIILRKRIDIRKNLHFVKVFFLITLLVALIAIALLWGDFSLYEVLGASRSYFYIGLCFLFFDNKNEFSIVDVMYISLGSLIGWAVTSYLNLQLSIIATDEIVITYGAMLAIPIFIIVSLSKKYYFLFTIGIIFIIFTSFTAGIRRQMLIVILSLCLYLFFIFINRKKSISVLFMALPVFLVILFMPYFEDYLSANSPALYKRVFIRTETLFSDDDLRSTSEESRLNNFNFYIDNIERFQIPRGFVSKSSSSKADFIGSVGRFNDFPLLELTSILGTFPFFLVFLFLLKLCVNNFKNYLYYKRDENMLFCSTFVIMIVLLFLEGSFINFAYSVPFTGYCLGRLKYNSVQRNLLRTNDFG